MMNWAVSCSASLAYSLLPSSMLIAKAMYRLVVVVVIIIDSIVLTFVYHHRKLLNAGKGVKGSTGALLAAAKAASIGGDDYKGLIRNTKTKLIVIF